MSLIKLGDGMLRKTMFGLAALLVCVFAQAETGAKAGHIKNIRVHDTQWTGWEPPLFWFTVDEIVTAANCITWNGNVLFISDSELTFSMVLAAQASGQKVLVNYDDSKTTNGYCRASYVTIGNSLPAY